MKITTILLLAACIQVSAKGHAQRVTLHEKEAPLERVMAKIKQQTGYTFVYTESLLLKAKKITIELKESPLQEALTLCFANQPLAYTVIDKTIVIKPRVLDVKTEESAIAPPPPIDIKGRVVNDKGEAVEGASVQVKGSATKGTTTNANGDFILKGVEENATLVISALNIETYEVKLNGRTDLATLTVKTKTSELDEMIVQAYGTTTKRLNTGSIGKVTAAEIEKQPVSNPLAALAGRVPGLIVTQSSGVPGSSFRVQIRGRNSIAQGSEPLYIIDGVPFAPGNNFLNQLPSAIGDPNTTSFKAAGESPLNLINPNDIESIEVLKDADATAIYGSRGANGVILITTKKGKPGKIKLNFNVSTGISKVKNRTDMLNTQQYVQMRKEAYYNDTIIPNSIPNTSGYAPDIMIWDTTRYTDLSKLLIGGNAQFTNAQLSFSGGNNNMQFMIGGGVRRQTTVFPGDNHDNQSSVQLSITNNSLDKRFRSFFSANYLSKSNNLAATDLTSFLYLPPNLPDLYDSLGKLNWIDKGITFNNPLSYLHRVYSSKTSNLISNLQLSYKILSSLEIKISAGYNTTDGNEKSIIPKSSIDPLTAGQSSATFTNNSWQSWIVEPQAEFQKNIIGGQLKVLVGGTWQSVDRFRSYTAGQNYTSDALLGSVNAAAVVTARNSSSEYRYNAFFGRVSYDFQNRYLLNMSGRRDGTSRFGPGKQFSNFAAVGGAWIFSSERFFTKLLPFFSFGKLRGSYGSTGNDQIGDYQYLDSWVSTDFPYQGNPGVYPIRLNNPDYSWEINKKLEGAIEIGAFKDRVFLTTSYFRNRSSNQLINYALPGQTGFSSITKNLDALIQNTGWEFSVSSKNVTGNNFNWESSLNLTAQKNKLISFPGLSTSSYANQYIEGQSLSVLRGYEYLGVDPNSGVFTFIDVDKDGKISSPNDYKVLGNLDPRLFGGLSNSIRYKNWQLDLFIQFVVQEGRNYLYDQLTHIPGSAKNQPTYVLKRWQTSGDQSTFQKFTTTPAKDAYKAMVNLLANSNGLYTDASFIRGKNLSIAYTLPKSVLKELKIENFRLFIQVQNIFTITNFKGADPETQSIYKLPPLMTMIFGLSIKL